MSDDNWFDLQAAQNAALARVQPPDDFIDVAFTVEPAATEDEIAELRAIKARAVEAFNRAAEQVTQGMRDPLTTTRWNLCRHILGDPTV